MSRRVLIGLLAVSVALNASFVGGFLYYRHVLRTLETPEGRANWVARRFQLDQAQRDGVSRVSEEWRSLLARVQRDRGAEIEAFWTEVVKDDPDVESLRAKLEPLLEAQRQTTVEGVERMVRIFRLLPPPQRRELAEMLKKRKDRVL